MSNTEPLAHAMQALEVALVCITALNAENAFLSAQVRLLEAKLVKLSRIDLTAPRPALLRRQGE